MPTTAGGGVWQWWCGWRAGDLAVKTAVVEPIRLDPALGPDVVLAVVGEVQIDAPDHLAVEHWYVNGFTREVPSVPHEVGHGLLSRLVNQLPSLQPGVLGCGAIPDIQDSVVAIVVRRSKGLQPKPIGTRQEGGGPLITSTGR